MVWNNIESYDKDKGEFENWLVGISKYKCLDIKRKYFKDMLYENIEELNIEVEDTANIEVINKELDDDYNVFNNYNVDIDNIERESFNELEKKKIINKFKKSIKKKNNRNKRNVIVAALAILILIGGLNNEVRATVVNTLKLVTKDISTILGIKENINTYKTVVDRVISNDKMSIQLNEVILDGNDLIVSSTIEVKNEEMKGKPPVIVGDLFVNSDSQLIAGFGTTEIIDESTYIMVMKYKFKSDNFSGVLDFEIVYDGFIAEENVIDMEPLAFKFNTSGDELAADTKEYIIDKRFTLADGTELVIEKYTDNAMGRKIHYSTYCEGNTDVFYKVILKGKDSEGNSVSFSTVEATNDGGILKIDYTLPGLSDNATYVTVTPYTTSYNGETGDSIKVGEEFVINLK